MPKSKLYELEARGNVGVRVEPHQYADHKVKAYAYYAPLATISFPYSIMAIITPWYGVDVSSILTMGFGANKMGRKVST